MVSFQNDHELRHLEKIIHYERIQTILPYEKVCLQPLKKVRVKILKIECLLTQKYLFS